MTQAKPRISALSGLKVLAVFLVIACHLGVAPRLDLCARMVEVLFVVSGFCMAYNHYGDEQEESGTALAFRKYKRFLPLHLLTFFLQLFFVETWLHKPIEYILSVGALNLTLMHAWFSHTAFSFNNVSWFLSALVFCYLITPELKRLVYRAEIKRYFWVLFFSVFAVRMYIEYMVYAHTRLVYVDLHTNPAIQGLNYSLGYLFGVCFLREGAFNRCLKAGLSFGGLSLLQIAVAGFYLAAVLELSFMYRGVFVLLAAMLIYVLAAGGGMLSRVLSAKPLVWLENITLEAFMLHSFILYHYPAEGGNLRYYMQFGAIVLLAALFCFGVRVMFYKRKKK